jgi:hypothetical protein
VSPGDRLELSLRLQDFRGAETTLAVSVRIPASLAPGRLRLLVGSSDSLLVADVSRAQTAYEPRSLAELVRLLTRLGQEDELAAIGYVEATGLTLGSRELPQTPTSLRGVIGAQASGTTDASRAFETRFPMGRPVYGTAELELEVRR